MAASWVAQEDAEPASAATEPSAAESSAIETSATDSDDGNITVLTAGSPMGVRSYTPGRWGLVRVVARNSADQADTVGVRVSVRDTPELRYSREIWVPAKSVRTSWLPIYLPDRQELGGRDNAGLAQQTPSAENPPAGVAPAGAAGHAAGAAGHAAAGPQFAAGTDEGRVAADITREIVGEVLDDGKSLGTGDAFLTKQTPAGSMAYIDNNVSPQMRANEKYLPYEAILALRQSRGLNRTLNMINERLLPPTVEGWDALKYVVIVGDRLNRDSAAIRSLRQWLSEGGRIWVQLNTVDEMMLRQLLGGAYQVEEIDRVELTEFAIKLTGFAVASEPFRRELEQPVELIRLMVDNAQVLFEIDGWPAAFVIPFGEGEVIVTTLSAGGWIRPHDANDPPFSDPRDYTDFMATEPLRDLAARFLRPPAAPQIAPELQAVYVTDRIGYEIPSRGYVLAILLGFCAAIALTGTLLSTLGRLEHLSWVTVTLGLLATGIIVAAGRSSRQAVPPTASSQQIVRIIPETGEYTSSGTVALYQPDETIADLRSTIGTRIDPDLPKLRGKIREIRWSDADRWRWTDTELPPGVQLVQTRHGGSLPYPLQATASLTTDGLSGLLGGENRSAGEDGQAGSDNAGKKSWDFNDGLILFPNAPPLAANLQADGSFTAAIDDMLADGQFFSDGLLSDEQRRRMEILQAWITQYQSTLGQEPMLVAWSEDLAKAIQWPASLEQTGAALVAIPLELEPTPVGESVGIPGSLVRARALLSKFGQSTVFNNQTQSWVFPNSQSTVSRIRYQVPTTTLPLELQRARLTIDCNMPSRVLTLYCVVDGQRTKLLERTNPSGKLKFDLSVGDGLAIDAQGGITLDYEVGELTTEVEQVTMANSGWTIRSARLDIYGTTTAVTGEVDHE